MRVERTIRLGFASIGLIVAACGPLHAQYSFTLSTTPAGDATYSWNGTSGPIGYAGGNSLDVGLSFGYGNDYTVGIFMVPISALTPGSLNSATLHVTLNGFDTFYYYGSATMGWLDFGTSTPTLTGDVVADNLGPAAQGRPGGMLLYDSGGTPSGVPGVMSFDVLNYVSADLDAGRDYSVFVVSGSRDTWGSIMSAETGSGPYIVVDSAIPEPSAYAALVGALALAFAAWRRAGRS